MLSKDQPICLSRNTVAVVAAVAVAVVLVVVVVVNQ